MGLMNCDDQRWSDPGSQETISESTISPNRIVLNKTCSSNACAARLFSMPAEAVIARPEINFPGRFSGPADGAGAGGFLAVVRQVPPTPPLADLRALSERADGVLRGIAGDQRAARALPTPGADRRRPCGGFAALRGGGAAAFAVVPRASRWSRAHM